MAGSEPFTPTGHATFTDGPPRLPMDVFENIIDIIAELRGVTHPPTLRSAWTTSVDSYQAERHWRTTLVTCARVCKQWHRRSIHHLTARPYVSSREHVMRLMQHLRAYPDRCGLVRHIAVDGWPGSCDARPAPYLGATIAMLCRPLRTVERLTLSTIYWDTCMVHPKCISFLAAYRSLTHLSLVYMRFATVSLLRSLLSALSCIRSLECRRVSCDKANIVGPPYMTVHASALRELTVVECSDAVYTLFATSVKADHCAVVHFADLDTSAAVINGYQRVLDAYSSLRELKLVVRSTNANLFPMDLSGNQNLTKLSFAYIVNAMSSTPPDRLIPPLLSSLTYTRLTHLHISLRLGFYSARWPCPFPLDPAEGVHYLLQLDDINLFPDIDELVSRERAFSDISAGGLCLELLTRADLVPMLDAALQPQGDWAGFIGLRMPLSESRGILKCIRTSVPFGDDVCRF